jgi:hypothetical protein
MARRHRAGHQLVLGASLIITTRRCGMLQLVIAWSTETQHTDLAAGWLHPQPSRRHLWSPPPWIRDSLGGRGMVSREIRGRASPRCETPRPLPGLPFLVIRCLRRGLFCP